MLWIMWKKNIIYNKRITRQTILSLMPKQRLLVSGPYDRFRLNLAVEKIILSLI